MTAAGVQLIDAVPGSASGLLAHAVLAGGSLGPCQPQSVGTTAFEESRLETHDTTLTRAWLASDPPGLLLAQGEVQVWVLHAADVPACASALAYTLSVDERMRAGRYRAEVHRQRFIARRGMLRWLSARYLGCSPQALRWEVEGAGKPLWQQPAGPRLAFSVSQTESMALLAFAWDGRVGVDVQQALADVDIASVGQAVFSAAEQAALAGARGDDGAEFFRLWSRKEALLKAVGSGLSQEATSYTTQQDEPQRGRREWRAWHRGVPITGWTFLDLVPGAGVSAALAVSRREARVLLRPCPLPSLAIKAQ